MLRSTQYFQDISTSSPDRSTEREPQMSRACRDHIGMSWANMIAHGTHPRVLEIN